MIVLKRSSVSFERKCARLLIPDALSLQYCNLSRENDLSAAILHRRAAKRVGLQISKEHATQDL